MVVSAHTAHTPKYEWRFVIKVRGGHTMIIPAVTRTQAMVFLETLQPEYGRTAILQQRAAGKWVKPLGPDTFVPAGKTKHIGTKTKTARNATGKAGTGVTSRTARKRRTQTYY
jgi:hypothetical protein